MPRQNWHLCVDKRDSAYIGAADPNLAGSPANRAQQPPHLMSADTSRRRLIVLEGQFDFVKPPSHAIRQHKFCDASRFPR